MIVTNRRLSMLAAVVMIVTAILFVISFAYDNRIFATIGLVLFVASIGLFILLPAD